MSSGLEERAAWKALQQHVEEMKKVLFCFVLFCFVLICFVLFCLFCCFFFFDCFHRNT